MGNKLTHFDRNGNAVMVDVTEKEVTSRTAAACSTIRVNKEIMQAVLEGSVKKEMYSRSCQGSGYHGRKKTSDLIPMCHPLPVGKCSISMRFQEEKQEITAICTVKTDGKTGVEMEALTGVQTALLTIYDMCKAIDKRMVSDGYSSGEQERRKERGFYI